MAKDVCTVMFDRTQARVLYTNVRVFLRLTVVHHPIKYPSGSVCLSDGRFGCINWSLKGSDGLGSGFEVLWIDSIW